jgi:ribosome biogenesis GTPase
LKKPRKRKRAAVRKRTWTAGDVDEATRQRRFESSRQSGDASFDLETLFSDCEPNGLVVSPYGVLAFVLADGEERLCKVDDALVDGKTSVLAPGDEVHVEAAEDDWMVRAVRTRTSRLSRPAVGRKREQTIAANVDVLVIVASAAQPSFKPGLVDRYLIAAEVGGVQPVICVNKIDLVESEPEEAGAYRQLGVEVVGTSCESGAGLDALREQLTGKLAVFAGHSGVGKSSLINQLNPDLELDTQEISESTNKGRHTTTASRLYALPGGTRLIDTPGIKQLGLWGVSPEELDYYFPEMQEVATGCRFRDCTHVHEPHCAVKDAVQDGTITRLRYDSYVRIRESYEAK